MLARIALLTLVVGLATVTLPLGVSDTASAQACVLYPDSPDGYVFCRVDHAKECIVDPVVQFLITGDPTVCPA